MTHPFFHYLMKSEIGDSIAATYGEPARERMDFYNKWLRNVASDEQIQKIAQLYARWRLETSGS